MQRIGRYLFIVTGVFLGFFSQLASGENAIVFSVDHGKISIDGRSDESVWKKAQIFHLEHSLSQEKPCIDTTFQFLCDGKTLYLAVRCEQPVGRSVVAKYAKRDEAVWQDDCVGLSIDPSGQGREYYRFLFSPRGTLWDARSLGGKDQDDVWNAQGVQVAGYVGQGFWSAELAVPICNFLSPENPELSLKDINDTTWRFNVTREYKGGLPKYLTYFAMGNFFDTASFGVLTGLHLDYSNYAWKIFAPELQNVKPAGKKYRAAFNVSIENLSSVFRVFEFTADARYPDGQKKKLNIAPTFGADAGQTQKLPFTLTLDGPGDIHLRFYLRDKETNEIVSWREYKSHIDTSPLTLLITDPFYRSAIYATMDVKNIEMELASRWPVQFNKTDRLSLLLTDSKGKTIVQKELSDRKTFLGRHILDIPKLSPGDYVCKASVAGEGRSSFEAQTILHVYGPSTSEVRVNKHLNFVKNGKEVFPIGFFHSPWGSPAGKNCDVALLYGCADELKGNPSKQAYFDTLGREGRSLFLFPYPQAIWPHQAGGNNELAHKPLVAEHARMIADRVSQYSQQPGLFGWYLADEPTPQLFQPDYLNAVARTIRQADPYHPCYISFNFGYRSVSFEQAADAAGIHWYVGFTDRGPVYPMASVVQHVQDTCKGLNNRKAVIFSPQLIVFSHQEDEDIRPVSHNESRCMAYLGIVGGAKGIMWYSASALASSLEVRIGIPVLIEELRKLDYVFLAHDTVPVTVPEKDALTVYTMGKIVNGQLYVIAVNAADHPVETKLSLPKRWCKMMEISELASKNKVQSCEKGTLPVKLLPYQVRLFTTDSLAPELTSMEELQDRFKAENDRLIAEENFCYAGRGAKLEVSSDYGNWGKSRLLIDGYKGWGSEIYSFPKKGSWFKINFPQTRRIARIEVSSNDFNMGRVPGRLKEYDLEVLVGGQWKKPVLTIKEKSEDTVYMRIHTFDPVDVDAIRLTMREDSLKSGFVNEIQAYSPNKN